MNRNLPNRIESEYRRALNRFSKSIEQELQGIDDPQEIVRRIRQISERREYAALCDELARSMVTGIYKKTAASWREAARQSTRSAVIYHSIKEELHGNVGTVFYNKMAENAALVKNFPRVIAQNLTRQIQNEALGGRRAEDIAAELMQQYRDKSEAQVRLIARTTVSQTQAALTQARSENLGIEWYIWRTSGDGRVRDSHRDMDGVLCRWSDPPNSEALFRQKGVAPYGRYNAGETFNDRCYAEPVVSPDFVSFPARVHVNGQIRVMTRAQFEKLAVGD